MDEGGTVADILHVVDTFLPHATGGSEVYVETLIAALRAQGLRGVVASASAGQPYEHAGTPVVPISRALIDRVRPRVVHLHSFAPTSELMLDAARDVGLKTVFTYLIPAASCTRGTMLLMGRTPCDGRLDVGRCTACTLVARGHRPSVARAVAAMPAGLARRLGGPFAATAKVADAHARFSGFMARIDRVIATSAWVVDVLERNGVPAEKVVLCRFGTVSAAVPETRGAREGPLRLAFFGRLHATKGVDILIDALARVAEPVRLDIYGVSGPSTEAYAARVAALAARDPRIAMRPRLAPEEVIATMGGYDAVAIPSRWMETGPLVALEAFAAGTPVIGTGIGGIAELVSDGIDGVLVGGADPAAWATTISFLAQTPDRVARLRSGVRRPRSVEEVASDMAALYASLA